MLKSNLGCWWLWTSADSSHPREMRWSCLSATGPQSWYQVAPLLAGPAGGQGQGSHHWAPSLRPGEETLVHHCKEACCPAHVAPKWTVPGHLSSGVNCLPCSHTLKPTHHSGESMRFVFHWFDVLHFRECLISQVPLKKYHIDYNFDRDYY